MAQKKITIPITDHDENCTQYYLVEYKLTGAAGYSSFHSFTNEVIVSNLEDESTYDVRITRFCCNGSSSAALELEVDTTTDSPQLDAPENFTLEVDETPVTGELIGSWDSVAEAEGYTAQISSTSDFTNIVYIINTAAPLTDSPATGLTPGNTYYGRVKAIASGYTDSDWSNVDSGVPITV